jgi:heme-degrading monooxygenase HmoA
MIARIWRGRASPAKADAYARHFTHSVLPALKTLAGHRGAYLPRSAANGVVEFSTVTLWESRDSIEAFAGADISKAHVEPEGRAALSDFDAHADHYDVVVSAVP